MRHVALILAGGSGSRMGQASSDKILLKIGSKTVFAHTLHAFVRSRCIDGVVIVARDNRQRRFLAEEVRLAAVKLPVLYTIGGKERQDSVLNGLSLLPDETAYVYIHDCARPAIAPEAIRSLRTAVTAHECPVSLAHRVTDTIRQFTSTPLEKPVKGTLLERSSLWAMETPQVFPRPLIEKAHIQLKVPVTDDIAATEKLGLPTLLLDTGLPNPKLTRPADLHRLEIILADRKPDDLGDSTMRVGIGYDIHRLKKGLPLVLGGIRIDADVGLVGHSDADVLSHALADAILGAAGLPDIGHWFPNTDPSIAGISSQAILRKAVELVSDKRLRLVNVDATLIAEKPKIAPYLAQMKETLGKTLQLDPSAIGLKATTQEQIGSLGKAEGIAAHAVAALTQVPD
jgi:2-C-methyl-D-erythritol 4-phosphate cytidylyltransferase/2-C-methyl-D-erythritol 2,4-cyclodiphosphate synthase